MWKAQTRRWERSRWEREKAEAKYLRRSVIGSDCRDSGVAGIWTVPLVTGKLSSKSFVVLYNILVYGYWAGLDLLQFYNVSCHIRCCFFGNFEQAKVSIPA